MNKSVGRVSAARSGNGPKDAEPTELNCGMTEHENRPPRGSIRFSAIHPKPLTVKRQTANSWH